jgi:tetratricopeptide (TPR) repeat protein
MPNPPITDLIHQALQAEQEGQVDEACALLRQAAEGGDTPLTLNARLHLGRLLLYDDRHYVEAEAVLRTARTQAEKAGAPRQAAVAIHLLAKLKRDQAQVGGAHYLDEAQQLLDEHDPLRLPGAPGPEAAQWFHYRGLIHDDRDELDDAERRFFRAHELYRETGFRPGLAQVANSLANLMLKQGRSHGALECARFSLKLKEEMNDLYGQSLSLGAMGQAYLLQARFEEARAALQKDLELSTRLNNQRGIGIGRNHLGEVELAVGNLDAARDHYQANLDRQGCAPHVRMQAFAGLARVHLAAGRTDQAAAMIDQLDTLLRQSQAGHLPAPQGTAGTAPKVPTSSPTETQGLPSTLLGLRGALARRRGDFPEGERLLRQAIAGLEGQGQNLDTLPFLYELRDLYQEHRKAPEAVKVMRQALELLDWCGAEGGVRAVEEWLRTVQSPDLVRLARSWA